MRSAALAVLCLLVTRAGGASQEARDLDKRISVSKRGTFNELVQTLRDALGTNIVIDPRAAERVAGDETRELVLKDVKGSSALQWLTSLFGLDSAIHEGVVVIGSGERLPVVRQLHDVRSLQVQLLDHPGPRVSLPERTTMGFSLATDEPGERSGLAYLVVELIKENIAPGQWDGDYVIEYAPNQRLVVTAPALVQKQISSLLDALRSLSPPMVTLSAEIVEADDDSAPLLQAGPATVYGKDEVERVAEKLKGAKRAGKTRSVQVTGHSTQRVHAAVREDGVAVVGLGKAGEVVASGVPEVVVLDARPTLVSEGRFLVVEMRLALGQSGELKPALRVGGKEIAYPERALTSLGTTFLVPNGGGVLFSLPPKAFSGGRTQLCLLRAATTPVPPFATMSILETGASHWQSALTKRLREAAPASIDLKEASFDEFLKWLRAASGVNVVASEEVREKRVSIQCRDVALRSILKLVLEPLGLGFAERDEAIFIASRERLRKEVQLAVLDVRDLTCSLRDFGSPKDDEVVSCYTGDDIAQLTKMTIHKEDWEEADGKSIAYNDGIIFVRNSPEVLRECIEFLEGMRPSWQRIMTLQAETLVVPAAAADAILKRAGVDTHLIDDAQYRELSRLGVVQQQLGWHCHETQQTTMAWERGIGYAKDLDEFNDPVVDTHLAFSCLAVRPYTAPDGRSIVLEIGYEDRPVLEVKLVSVGEGRTIQAPVGAHVSLRTTISMPKGGSALFKWSEPAKEGGGARYRLLLLKAAAWEEKK